MQRPLLSAESFFSEEPLFAHDGLLNEKGLAQNSTLLEKEFEWLNSLFQKRVLEYTDRNVIVSPIEIAGIPEFTSVEGPFAHLLQKIQLGNTERVLLLLALETYYQPLAIIERLNLIKKETPDLQAAFAYYKDPFSQNLYPTLQTAIFLTAGKNHPTGVDVNRKLFITEKSLKSRLFFCAILMNVPGSETG